MACLDRFAGDVGAKNISNDTLFPDDNVRLTGDAGMFDRMLDNLVSNAIKFTPNGGCITVDVSLDSSAALLVSVADTGIGHACSKQPKQKKMKQARLTMFCTSIYRDWT